VNTSLFQVVSIDVQPEAAVIQIDVRNGDSSVEVQASIFSDGKGGGQPESSGAERRIDTEDSKAYTLQQFKTMYGPIEGEDIWNTAPKVPTAGSIVSFQRLNGKWNDYGHVVLRLKRALVKKDS